MKLHPPLGGPHVLGAGVGSVPLRLWGQLAVRLQDTAPAHPLKVTTRIMILKTVVFVQYAHPIVGVPGIEISTVLLITS